MIGRRHQLRSRLFGLCVLIAVGVVMLPAGLVAGARSGDFDPASDAWNGLGYLLETAREAQVQLEVSPSLDWSEISADEVLFVVAPHVGPGSNGADLRRFVRAGGRIIIADDFRAGARWLQSFGIQVLQRPGPSARYAAGVRHLPELQGGAELGDFLGYHVPQVVLNHPAALIATTTRGWQHRALGRFGDGVRSWAMEAWRHGEQGRVLAVSDPSLLINAMIRRFYGNKQVGANLLRYFCFEGEPCRVRLLANLRQVNGHFQPSAPQHGLDLDVRRRLQRFMDSMGTFLARRELRPLWWLLVVLAMVTPILRSARLPRARLPPQAPGRDDQGRLRHTVRAWLARPDADYRRPARQLANHLSRTVTLADQEARSYGGPLDAPPTSATLSEAIGRLVARGNLAPGSGRRILDLVGVLEEVADRLTEPVDRDRFTQLAAEVDWAEQVLSHTTLGRKNA